MNETTLNEEKKKIKKSTIAITLTLILTLGSIISFVTLTEIADALAIGAPRPHARADLATDLHSAIGDRAMLADKPTFGGGELADIPNGIDESAPEQQQQQQPSPPPGYEQQK